MDLNVLSCPTMINVTASIKEWKIMKFMFGVSVLSGIMTEMIMKNMLYKNNRLVAMSSSIGKWQDHLNF